MRPRQLVAIDGRTSPIEVCDILTSDGELIHVKPKHNSSTLSHLFAQGVVSAELVLTSGQFRERALAKINEAIVACGGDLDPHDAASLRSAFEAQPRPGALRVVYAIAALWDGKPLARVLPFFSSARSICEHMSRSCAGWGIRSSTPQSNAPTASIVWAESTVGRCARARPGLSRRHDCIGRRLRLRALAPYTDSGGGCQHDCHPGAHRPQQLAKWQVGLGAGLALRVGAVRFQESVRLGGPRGGAHRAI